MEILVEMEEYPMRAVWRLILCFVPLILAAACGPALRVTKSNQPVDGIPFYVKEARCLHQMVYTMPYYRLTLQSLNGQKVQGSESITISEHDYVTNATVQSLLTLLRKKPPLSDPDFIQVSLYWNDIQTLSSKSLYEADWPSHLISNSMTAKVFVNYGTVYTLNAKSPLAGSVNADYKLGPDGTLTEASAQITDQTLSTILAALPISNLITTAASGGFAAALVEGVPPPTQITVQMVVEQRAIKTTKSQIIPFTPGCPDDTKFATDPPNTPKPPLGILVEDVGADSVNSSQSKADDNSINVSGKITLPKPKDASSASDNGGKTAPAPQPGTPH
jgi:hypothetical protein